MTEKSKLKQGVLMNVFELDDWVSNFIDSLDETLSELRKV